MSKRIGEALIERGLISRAQLARALRGQLIFGGTLGTCLMELGYMDEAALGRILSEIVGLKCARAEMFADIPADILETVPLHEVRKRHVVPIGLDGKSLHVAATDKTSLIGLSSVTGFKIVPYMAPEMRILLAMEKYYGIPRRPRYLKVSCESMAGKKGTRPPGSTAGSKRAGIPEPPTDYLEEEAAPRAEQPEPALADLSRRMSRVSDHAELGEVVLDFVATRMERGILFEVSQETAGVANWKGVKLDPDKVRDLRLPVTTDSIFALATEDQCYRGGLPAEFDRRSFFGRLGMEVPREILVLPIYGDNCLEAILYGDGGSAGRVPGPTDVYLILLDQIDLALKMLAYRTRLASA